MRAKADGTGLFLNGSLPKGAYDVEVYKNGDVIGRVFSPGEKLYGFSVSQNASDGPLDAVSHTADIALAGTKSVIGYVRPSASVAAWPPAEGRSPSSPPPIHPTMFVEKTRSPCAGAP